MKLRFFHKLFALALGLALAVLGVSTFTFFMTAEGVLVRGLGDEALTRALAAVEELEPSDFGEVFRGNTEPGEDWERLVSRLAELQSRLGPAGVENVYVLAQQDGAPFRPVGGWRGSSGDQWSLRALTGRRAAWLRAFDR